MSLLNAMAERCVRLVPEEKPDGLGGTERAWAEGETFDAVLLLRREDALVEGQRTVARPRYDVLVGADTALGFRDVFRRLSDGGTFRMTGDTRNCAAPQGAGVAVARAGCEGWDVP